jgi:hypothetical protein
MASSSRLKAGEEGKIITKINTKGKTGTIHKNVQVYSNDPKRFHVTLVLKAIIQQQNPGNKKSF